MTSGLTRTGRVCGLLLEGRDALRIFIVHNPVSGTFDPEHVRTVTAAHFDAHGIEYEVHTTAEGDPIPEIVRAAAARGFDRIAAAGGDGTVSAVANGLLHGEVSLGIIPTGTGNAFAREMEVPLDLEEALSVLTGSEAIKVIDTLTIGDRHFIMSVSAGVSAATMAATDREQKRRFGKLAYFLEGLGELQQARGGQVTLHVDGRQVQMRAAAEVIVANTGQVGFKKLRLSPDVRPDDGQMNVCVIRVASVGAYLRLLGYALGGDPTQLPEMKCFPGEREIRIEADRPLQVQADGEAIGETPVSVGIAPQSLRVVVPQIEPESAGADRPRSEPG
ncbi:MAG TPA: diacylglycerol kinase family protein [Anaerolineales bacterium]|nr:diacylglycerol kinase family protein [Anaerolineales bacterium]